MICLIFSTIILLLFALFINLLGISKMEYTGGSDFPYRREKLKPTVHDKLKVLLKMQPNIEKKHWNIPNKVVKKVKNLFNSIPIVVKPEIENHWEYDQIIDYYNEPARIKTPGYGEKYSPYDYWNKKELHKRWKSSSITDPREAIYNSITEARPAYSSVSISLYKYFIDILPMEYKNNVKILDIAAYGERAIAAANLGVKYYGVDPNTDLKTGHQELINDINNIKKSNIKFIYIGLEDYETEDNFFDIITYSPPPFNTEPYHGNKELQSYIKYPTKDEYFCCFLTELIYKASRIIKLDGVFSFTALDRNPTVNKLNIPEEYISDNTELIYVEALLLLVLCYGFTYHGAVGLAVGNKPPRVPWWTFKFIESNMDNCEEYILMFEKHYKEWFNLIGPRLISNLLLNSKLTDKVIFKRYMNISSTDKYKISNFSVGCRRLTYEEKIFLEIVRLNIQNYICHIIADIGKIKINKVKTILGRYLMLRSITASFDRPWNSCLFVDPIFPTFNKESLLIEEHIIKNFEENNLLEAKFIIQEYKYKFGAYTCIGITSLYDTIANYIPTLTLSKVKINIEKNGSFIKIKGNNYVNKVLSKYNNNSDIIWNGTPDIENLLVYLRYETLSAKGHQFTRCFKRTKILEKILDSDIIDIYASIYNNQSEYYCSVFPDIEEKSIGSAFCLKMLSGSYLANPVDIPVFLEYSIKYIKRDLYDAYENNKTLNVCMAFTVWMDTNPSFIESFKKDWSQAFKESDNTGLQLLHDFDFIKGVYILNKDKFPSVCMKKTNIRNTISVGIIMSTVIVPNINDIYLLAEHELFKIV
jgi:hypothetical protein